MKANQSIPTAASPDQLDSSLNTTWIISGLDWSVAIMSDGLPWVI